MVRRRIAAGCATCAPVHAGSREDAGGGPMGAPKIRCPGCGAKNDTNSRRCRVCATLINMKVPEPGKSGEGVEMGGSSSNDTFDPNAIQQQLRPKSQMFKSGGGLGARIA